MPIRFNRYIRGLKRWLPSSLFYRALLILLVPVIVLQLLIAHIFYDRHWNSVVRNMSGSAAAEVAMLMREYEILSDALGHREALRQTADRSNMLGIDITYREGLALQLTRNRGRNKFPDFYDNLNGYLPQHFEILNSRDDLIGIRINTRGGVMDVALPRKRLASSTTVIFITWMVGSALLLTTIAILFLRNQIRPIVALARTAEQFGLGQEAQHFSPRGASEVRRAGRAFLMMAERIRRQVQSRTEMLAGISHDLRTPLTRMTLELEMGKVDRATRDALTAEIEEMRRMIDEYLDFARGDVGEVAEPMELDLLLGDVVAQYQRSKQKVNLHAPAAVTLMLRPQAMRRALTNLIDNALRYGGGRAEITLDVSTAFARIKVRDHGPGIPEQEHEAVFKPFTRLEPSRNSSTGGVGLGLSIARAVARHHGGEITLENQRDTAGNIVGLEATLRLPREVQQPAS